MQPTHAHELRTTVIAICVSLAVLLLFLIPFLAITGLGDGECGGG